MTDYELLEHIIMYANTVISLPGGAKDAQWWDGLRTAMKLVINEIKNERERRNMQ